MKKIMLVISAILILVMAVWIFMSQKSFGQLPRGERLQRVENSPNYKNGEFVNQEPTTTFTGEEGRMKGILKFLFRSTEGLRPERDVPAIKTNLNELDKSIDCVVWFGHGSYLVQIGGKRILVDPVFIKAAPLDFFNRPFRGTSIYSPDDMPQVDLLVITHDHWDHLDYETVMQIKERVVNVACPLGVGQHFEYWGFDMNRVLELDWHETAHPDSTFSVECLPSRHFSGRGPKANRTLWGSFMISTPERNLYISGDGGYGSHYAGIASKYDKIDLAIMENGQYNADWNQIHLMPDLLVKAVRDLSPKSVLTVHHSKYALARHPLQEPLRNNDRLKSETGSQILTPLIGEVVEW